MISAVSLVHSLQTVFMRGKYKVSPWLSCQPHWVNTEFTVSMTVAARLHSVCTILSTFNSAIYITGHTRTLEPLWRLHKYQEATSLLLLSLSGKSRRPSIWHRVVWFVHRPLHCFQPTASMFLSLQASVIASRILHPWEKNTYTFPNEKFSSRHTAKASRPLAR